ncbi:tyrosine-protein phosphatase [Nonomuraea sp. NPDC049152]|uniref:tyrosine-protein phosphatase n=1 Tax=Nonomuraea sp. NPDC049152 TaxID=3154350 RepID=UPI0033BFE154
MEFIASAPNLRDIGGHVAADGRKVRTGLAFRSGALDRLTPADQEALAARGVRLVCDLRTASERAAQPDRIPDGVEYLVLDVQGQGGHGADIAALFDDPSLVASLTSPEIAEGFLVEVYRGMVTTPDAHAAFGDLLRALSRPGTLMHCTAGKDRTGWGVALLLTVLGVDRRTVMADYLASNDHLAEAAGRIYAMLEGTGVATEVVRPLLEVREPYLDTAFDTIADLYGDVDGYVREALGLTDDDLAALRDLYLD